MLIREFEENDYEKLLDLWNELDLNSPERGDTLESIKRTFSHGGRMLLIENPEDRSLLGSSWITCDGRRMFLHHFGIRKDYQQKGLGRKLLDASLAFIAEAGYQVKLEVHKENRPAKQLYEKAGFFAFTDYDIYMIRKPDSFELYKKNKK